MNKGVRPGEPTNLKRQLHHFLFASAVLLVPTKNRNESVTHTVMWVSHCCGSKAGNWFSKNHVPLYPAANNQILFVVVQNTLAYSMYGEIGARAVAVNIPGAILRWFIDQW